MMPSAAVPISFGTAERPLAGWLHRPGPAATLARDVGLVICKPFGYEAICAHRSLRHFSDAAAALGVPTLRFDYDGTGDSAGDDRDPKRLESWIGSVHQAVDEMRRRASAPRIYLLGVRMGATLAALAARERDDVSGLVAIVPVLSGKSWLRELNALEIAMRLAGPPPGLELRPDEQESVGYVITAETKGALQAVDLLALTRPPAQDILILDRDDLVPNLKWAERLAALGARVDHRRLPGYVGMMLDPHEAIIPAEMVSAFSEWLQPRVAETAARAAASPPPESPAGPRLVASGVEETAGFLNESRNLFGIVSAPDGMPRPTRAIVLLNSGAIPHVGPGRLYVQLARRWAPRGYLVLRFDQAGIGDSAPFQGEPENVVYSPSAVRGIAEALEFLRVRWGVTECHALGLCSGAYHAFKAAVAGLPLKTVAIVNPLVFFWKPGMSLAYPPYLVSEATTRYKRALLRWDKWKKVFAGRVSVREFANVVMRRAARRAARTARDVARAIGNPLPNDLGADLEAVADRGVGLRFVFATGDPGEDLLRSEGGSSVGRLLRHQRLGIRRIEGPNHAFTPVWTRIVLTEVLEEELELR